MITVIIPNYNDNRISKAISSILASDAEIEVIIVDGKSSNQDLLDYYDSIEDARVVRLKYNDKGIFDAINHGVENSSGSIIYLQGSDDFISHPEIFQDVLKVIGSDERLHGYCMGCKFVDQHGKVKRRWFPKAVTSRSIKAGILPPHFSLFLRRKIYDVVGPFEAEARDDLALDSLWLVKMGVLFKDLNIYVDDKRWLNMGLGGLSTGSYRRIIDQNIKLYRMLHRASWRPAGWQLIPIVKVFSKVFQFIPEADDQMK